MLCARVGMCAGPSNGKGMLRPGGESRGTRLPRSVASRWSRAEFQARSRGSSALHRPDPLEGMQGSGTRNRKHRAVVSAQQARGLRDGNASSSHRAGDENCKVKVSAELGASEAARAHLLQAWPLAAGALLAVFDKPWFVDLCLRLAWHSPGARVCGRIVPFFYIRTPVTLDEGSPNDFILTNYISIALFPNMTIPRGAEDQDVSI